MNSNNKTLFTLLFLAATIFLSGDTIHAQGVGSQNGLCDSNTADFARRHVNIERSVNADGTIWAQNTHLYAPDATAAYSELTAAAQTFYQLNLPFDEETCTWPYMHFRPRLMPSGQLGWVIERSFSTANPPLWSMGQGVPTEGAQTYDYQDLPPYDYDNIFIQGGAYSQVDMSPITSTLEVFNEATQGKMYSSRITHQTDGLRHYVIEVGIDSGYGFQIFLLGNINSVQVPIPADIAAAMAAFEAGTVPLLQDPLLEPLGTFPPVYIYVVPAEEKRSEPLNIGCGLIHEMSMLKRAQDDSTETYWPSYE